MFLLTASYKFSVLPYSGLKSVKSSKFCRVSFVPFCVIWMYYIFFYTLAFEEILHIDDEDDNLEFELPATIQGSLNVLKRMLEQPFVFSDNDRSNCMKKGELKPKVSTTLLREITTSMID